MNRTKSYDKIMSEKMQNPEFAKEYILASMEGDEPQTLIEALFEVISIIGIKEYSELVGLHESSISRAISVGDIPKIETLNKFLAPFNLKARLDVEEVA